VTTLLLSRSEVERLLTPDLCIAAVEEAFGLLARGEVPPPGILGMHAGEGSFHVKAGFLTLDRPYFAAKLNANFPGNGARHGLPTIQGAVLLSDASNGTPLAIMDSMSITALRTAAASAVAARHLAKKDCGTVLIVGCGGQAPAQLQAILRVRKPRRVLAFDQDPRKAATFAASVVKNVTVASELAGAVAQSDLIVTCTTSKRYLITREMVRPGTFIAAVGADNPEKQELTPALLSRTKIVADLLEQAAAMGDLHHALEAGAVRREDVHGELADVICGRVPGRTSDDETFVFDSTGTALQDMAVASIAVRRAV